MVSKEQCSKTWSQKKEGRGRVAGTVVQCSSIILASTRSRIQSPVQESRSHLEGLCSRNLSASGPEAMNLTHLGRR